MGLIDVDQVISDIKSHNNMEENNPTWRSKDVVTLLENAPEPPNAPLTLEQLREMDGEPVCIYNGYNGRYSWRVIEIATTKAVVFTDGTARTMSCYGDGWIAYRRKPEEGAL